MTPMSPIKVILQELKQRLVKFETVKGVVILTTSLVGLYVVLFQLQYILQALGALLFVQAIIEGASLITYNPIRKEAKKVIAREKYIIERLSHPLVLDPKTSAQTATTSSTTAGVNGNLTTTTGS